MSIRNFLPLAALALAGCEVQTTATSTLPEEVAALAAPYQDLRTAVLLPEDNCYWYSHAGPVETTLLPLRTRQGRPICVQQAEPEPSADS